MPTEQPAGNRDSASLSQTKSFHERVEEHRLWSDNQAFQHHEYERRRLDKLQKKGVLKADKHLKRARALYLPSVLTVLAGAGVLLYSTVDSLGGQDAPLAENRLAAEVIGGVLTALGLLALMAIAAYTYQREDTVRTSNGYPTLFESSRVKGGSSIFGLRQRENIAAVREFVDRREASALDCARPPAPLGRMLSQEEQGRATDPLLLSASSQLRESFSSASTTLSWLAKHEAHFYRLGPLLKRQSSDSALDRSFVRSHVHSPDQSLKTNREELSDISSTVNSKWKISDENHNMIEQSSALKTRLRCKNCLKILSSISQHGTKNISLCKERASVHCAHCDAQYPGDCEHRRAHRAAQRARPGLSIGSTDSSGYTGSECNYLAQRELSPDTPQPAEIRVEFCDGTQESDYTGTECNCLSGLGSAPPQPALKRVELCDDTRWQHAGGALANSNHWECGPDLEQVFASTAAVHAAWASPHEETASLSPPASPDISALPYLATHGRADLVPSPRAAHTTVSGIPGLLTLAVSGRAPIVSSLRDKDY
ncbi:hypothetical protein EGW08_022637 [Elysia chlorotica]|uniref:Uncharacterized protein n=1 Tax=Elysia chlorotica TaxID=188477 RepID=A0A3S1AQZ0_ELYCH|nr:hypothetical protein EGW08_022637 [Elysia chlorotica]